VERLTADALLTPDLPEEDVEIPGKGIVRVRALNRFESVLVRKGANDDEALIERRLLSIGMVEPKLTEAQVEHWQRTAGAMELVNVIRAINRLSGWRRQDEKEAYETFRGESGS
jgi:hypothetical protein